MPATATASYSFALRKTKDIIRTLHDLQKHTPLSQQTTAPQDYMVIFNESLLSETVQYKSVLIPIHVSHVTR
jgi:hypothetical protein